MMKIITKRIGIIILVIVALCVTCLVAPTLGQQIPFNEWGWKHYPVHKIRYYMSKALVEKLNAEKPNIEQTAEMLGQVTMGSHQVQLGDTYICYYLMNSSFSIMSLDMYTLDVYFDKDGTFLSAKVAFSD